MPVNARLLAALRWLRSEAGIAASDEELVRRAEKELKRPRDALHREWSKAYLAFQKEMNPST